MKRSLVGLGSLALLALASGCGAGTMNGSLPGTGTGTLEVRATVSTSNAVDNAADANGFDTSFEVSVRRAGQAVTDAQVVFTSRSVARTLVLDGSKYRGGHVGYDWDYTLSVVAGADRVEGAMIAGPSLHRIADPLPGATVPPQQALTIRWVRDAAADSASIETKRFKLDAAQDSGVVTVPGSYFPGKDGDAERDEVKIARTTRVGLAGGTAGSAIEATVENRVATFLVAPLP